eukprot:Phypoly_transcript_11435.p1 GENE.Phypoly_transcript_11435~~Phypoly_transcript_11435.p1  ORF type:complete len:362 (+),score=75.62 Phypoly_transcript_11435:31-1086(+)
MTRLANIHPSPPPPLPKKPRNPPNSRNSQNSQNPQNSPKPTNIHWAFIREKEGAVKRREGHIPPAPSRSLFSPFPSDNYGVTIATEYDLGSKEMEDLVVLNLDGMLVRKLRPYLGLKGEKAREALRKTRLHLSLQQVNEIDTKVQQHHEKSIASVFNKEVQQDGAFQDLPRGVQTVIASVTFQYCYGRNPNPKLKINKFWTTALSRDYEALEKELRNFGDKFAARRVAEADFLVEDLNRELHSDSQAMSAIIQAADVLATDAPWLEIKREKRETKDKVEWVITKERDYSKAQGELDKLYDMMEKYCKKYRTYSKAVAESDKLNAEMRNFWIKHEKEKADSVSLLPILKSKL